MSGEIYSFVFDYNRICVRYLRPIGLLVRSILGFLTTSIGTRKSAKLGSVAMVAPAATNNASMEMSLLFIWSANGTHSELRPRPQIIARRMRRDCSRRFGRRATTRTAPASVRSWAARESRPSALPSRDEHYDDERDNHEADPNKQREKNGVTPDVGKHSDDRRQQKNCGK